METFWTIIAGVSIFILGQLFLKILLEPAIMGGDGNAPEDSINEATAEIKSNLGIPAY